jgi:squalene-hopene/tetraprenyl-beta-curcumene cyclase
MGSTGSVRIGAESQGAASIRPPVVSLRHARGEMNMKHALALMMIVALVARAWGQASAPSPLQPGSGSTKVEHRGPGKGGEIVWRLRTRQVMERAGQFLVAAQGPDGSWAGETGPGITCLVLKALIQAPSVGCGHPAVQRGVEFVKRCVRDDGGIYSAEGLLKNYESSVALSMFAALNHRMAIDLKAGIATTGPTADAAQIAALQKFLTDNQWDEGEGKSVDDAWYGGAGYGRGQRPDLSNTQIMLDALHDSGLPPDDPAYKKALVFIQRCQMLGETNDQPFARGSSQGGFIYSPAGGGESKADEIEIGGRRELRCYGSMTYAGFKSMLYAGLGHDDRRVKAALDWMRANWTLDYNPNMPETRSHEGLYYYYHVFARALQAWGQNAVVDSRGDSHVWRQELVMKLGGLQRSDGSWVNEQERWMEDRPALATAYALLALEAAFPDLPALATQPAPPGK